MIADRLLLEPSPSANLAGFEKRLATASVETRSAVKASPEKESCKYYVVP
jgi:hypothetical protein